MLREREHQRQQELAHAQHLLQIQREQHRLKTQNMVMTLKLLAGPAMLLSVGFIWWWAATRARRRAVRLGELRELRLAHEQLQKDTLRQLLDEEDTAQARRLFEDLLRGKHSEKKEEPL